MISLSTLPNLIRRDSSTHREDPFVHRRTLPLPPNTVYPTVIVISLDANPEISPRRMDRYM